MFSGLNPAVFSVNRLNLEVEVENGSKAVKPFEFVAWLRLHRHAGVQEKFRDIADLLSPPAPVFTTNPVLIQDADLVLPQPAVNRLARLQPMPTARRLDVQ